MNTINIRNLVSDGEGYPIWHPYSSNQDTFFSKVDFVSGDGIYLYDSNGKEYVDVSSGLWNVFLGYNNARIQEAITQQMNKLAFCSLFEHTNEIAVKSASKLLQLLGNPMKQVIFGCSGSESVECAIKLMRSYWKNEGYEEKTGILSFQDSYHGTYYGGISVGGLEQGYVDQIGPCLEQVYFISSWTKESCNGVCDFKCLEQLRTFLAENSHKIAGIIIEPILASKGVVIPCKKYLIELVKLCKENDILVTFDEVAVGFYRTAKDFYYKKIGVNPNIVCLSKGINSGYLPLSVTAIDETIINAFKRSGQLLQHGSTQGGNLLSCAAMLASIEEYEQLKDELPLKAAKFREILIDAMKDICIVKDITCEGFLFGITLGNTNNEIHITDILRIKERLLSQGLIVYYSELGISLLPMLITTESEWINIVQTIEKELKKYI